MKEKIGKKKEGPKRRAKPKKLDDRARKENSIRVRQANA